MEAAKHRPSWVFKVLMALLLASTLAFPYAAFAFDEPHAAKQAEALGEPQSSDPKDDGTTPDVVDDSGEVESVEGSGESDSEEFEYAGAMDLSSSEDIEAYLAENAPANNAAKSDASLLDASYTASDEETLRAAFGRSYVDGEAVVSIKVTADIQLEGIVPLFLHDDQQVTIESASGATITAAQNARHFLVSSTNQASGAGYLLFKNIVLDGANSGGGIIFTQPGATYYVNAAPSGDDVSSDGYGLTIMNSRAGDGGAIQMLPNVKAELYGLQLADNEAANRGGAVFADDGAEVGLYRSTVTDNHAGVAGGAIYAGAPVNSWDNPVFSGKSSFEGNSATRGGAIYAKGSIAATASSFSSNVAAASGGAIYLEAAETLRVHFNDCGDDGTPTSFVGNRAGENGGAVFAEVHEADGEVSVSVNHTAFTANSAQGTMQGSAPTGNGGAIALYGDNVMLRVADCSEGGAPTAFSGNLAKANGGAIYAEGGSPAASSAYMDLAGAEVSSNTAGGDGGGVYASGRQVTVGTSEGCSMNRRSSIDGNTAGGSGGGIRIANTALPSDEGSYSNYVGSFGTVTHNMAEGDGGGISLSGGASTSAALYGVEISDNASNQGNGGGMPSRAVTCGLRRPRRTARALGSSRQ